MKLEYQRAYLAKRLMLKIIHHFDNGGESQRSQRSLLLSCAFQLFSKEFNKKVDPFEIDELRQYKDMVFPKIKDQYPLFVEYLPNVSNVSLISLLLYRQNSLMNHEGQFILNEMSGLLSACYAVEMNIEHLRHSDILLCTNEELVFEARDRTYSKQNY